MIAYKNTSPKIVPLGLVDLEALVKGLLLALEALALRLLVVHGGLRLGRWRLVSIAIVGLVVVGGRLLVLLLAVGLLGILGWVLLLLLLLLLVVWVVLVLPRIEILVGLAHCEREMPGGKKEAGSGDVVLCILQ